MIVAIVLQLCSKLTFVLESLKILLLFVFEKRGHLTELVGLVSEDV